MSAKLMTCTALLGIVLSACAPQTPQAQGGIDNAGTGSPGIAPQNSTTRQTSEREAPMQWIPYIDPVFGYSLTLPDSYTVLPETQPLSAISPNLLGRLRLLEPSLAKSAFAEMEPPKFSIEIYANAAALTLDNWIQTNTPGGEVEDVDVDGVKCAQLSLKIQLAPNQFILCNRGDKIYKFTPLGLYSNEMLASFKFGRE